MRLQRLPKYLRGYALNPFKPKESTYRLIRYLGATFLVDLREDVGWTMHAFRNFEDDEVMALSRMVKPDWKCLDIGGNIGFYSVMLGKMASRGRVISCEPLSRNVALIATNRLLNGLVGSTLQTLVGDRDGSAAFSESVDSSYASIKDTGRGGGIEAVSELEMLTVDTIVDRCEHAFDFVKIDIEGAEEMALRGMERTLASPHRPRLLMVEICDDNLRAFDSSGEALVARLGRHGYKPTCIRSGKLLPGVYSGRQSQNVLFAPA